MIIQNRFFLIIIISLVACKASYINTEKYDNTSIIIDSVSYKNLERNTKMVFSDFNGIANYNFSLNKIDAKVIQLEKPKMFALINTGGSYTILFPGDNIKISDNDIEDVIYESVDNENRNNELAFFREFNILQRKISPRVNYALKDTSIEVITELYNAILSQTIDYNLKAIKLADSLAIIYKINDTFKSINALVIQTKKLSLLNEMNFVFQKKLIENNLYEAKQEQLLQLVNEITSIEQISFFCAHIIDEVARNIMPSKIRRIENEKELLNNMSILDSKFKGISKDYILTKLMFEFLKSHSKITKRTLKKYQKSTNSEEYRLIIRKQISQNVNISKLNKRKKVDRLFSAFDSKIYSLNEVLEKNKGNVILIDFWASWCKPCLEQDIYIKKIKENFKNKKVVFIYISLDKDRKPWELRNKDLGLTPENSYLVDKSSQQDFIKFHKVEEIPRYILIDKNGQIITEDAPKPDDIELQNMINKYLLAY